MSPVNVPFRLAVIATVLAVCAPKRFLAFQREKIIPLGVSAASDDESVVTVSRAFWYSLLLVFASAVLGAAIGYYTGPIFGRASPAQIVWAQVTGASLLLWGTLFVRGWEIETYDGISLIERVNRWVYRALYCVGTAVIVASLTWPQAGDGS